MCKYIIGVAALAALLGFGGGVKVGMMYHELLELRHQQAIQDALYGDKDTSTEAVLGARAPAPPKGKKHVPS